MISLDFNTTNKNSQTNQLFSKKEASLAIGGHQAIQYIVQLLIGKVLLTNIQVMIDDLSVSFGIS